MDGKRAFMGEDRISELPVHIIHHILCHNLSRKEAAQTSVLSKKWNCFWISRPDFVLYQGSSMPLEELVKCVDQFLQAHVEQNLCLKRFNLHLLQRDKRLDSYLDGWINSVVKLNVKMLAVDYSGFNRIYYSLPDAVYAAKELTELSLSMCKFGFDISSSKIIRFHYLEHLFLSRVHILDDQLQIVIDSCPLIKYLYLHACEGVTKLDVRLVHLEKLFAMCNLKSAIVQAPRLRLLELSQERKKNVPIPDKIAILDGYNTLEKLELKDANITDKWFQDIIYKLLEISDLDLRNCYKLKKLEIRSDKLKRLALSHLTNLEQINIEAPNLMEFEFLGDVVAFSSIDFLHFVQKCDFSKDFIITLLCKESKAVHIYEDPSEVAIPPRGNVRISIKPVQEFDSFDIDRFFWGVPRIISIVPSANSKILEMLQMSLIQRQHSTEKKYVSLNGVKEVTSDTNGKAVITFMLEWKFNA